MTQDLYVDGISNIYLTGQLIRFDLYTLQPGLQTDQGQPVYNINQRIIMPLEGFVQAFAIQENLIKQLAQAGLLQAQPVVAQQNKTAQREQSSQNEKSQEESEAAL